MKKLLIILVVFASCKKDNVAPVTTNAATPEKYNSGVFFRVEKSDKVSTIDSLVISVAFVSDYKYTKLGVIKEFNLLDCEGVGLRANIDTGSYIVDARLYTSGKGFGKGIPFNVTSKDCMTVKIKY